MCGAKNDKVDFIIEDCGYSSGKEIIKYQIKLVKWVPLNSVYLLLNHKIKKRVGFSLNDVHPIKDIKKCKAPILFIHGDKDTCVPCSMAKKMYDVRKNKNDKLFIVPGADHMCAYSMKKAEYESICHEFIENAELIKNNRRK